MKTDLMQETQDFSQALRRMSAATYAVRETHSYACGYLEGLSTRLFACLTKKQREQFLREMLESAAKYEALAEVAGTEIR